MIVDPAVCVVDVFFASDLFTSEYLTAKSVDLRFESSWKSTITFHFTRLTCSFLQRSTRIFSQQSC